MPRCGADDNVVEEAFDRAGQEVAYRHVEFAQPEILAPLLVVVVVGPQGLQVTAESVNGAGAVTVARRREPVAAQFEVGELVRQASPHRAGHGQRGKLAVLRIRLRSLLG